MAFDFTIKAGTTSKIVEVTVRDSSTGAGKTGLAFGDVTASYVREGSTRTAITLASGTAGDAYSSGKWAEIDSTNCKGMYQLHLPDAAIATGVDAVTVRLQATGVIDRDLRIALPTVDLKPADGLMGSDVVEISGSSASADNLELQYDGVSGLSGDTFPSTQAQVKGIGSGTTGTVNFEAIEDNVLAPIKGASFVGSVTGGSLDDTGVEDGATYDIEDTGNVIDIVLGFDVGGGFSGNEVEIFANINGNADRIEIKAYNFVSSSWDTVGALVGSGGNNFARLNLSLLGRNTGTGADLGKVYIRFDTDSTTPASLEIDKAIVGAVLVSRSVGYENASVWIDTSSGTAGTEPFFNGVADNPVLTYANANSIAANVGLKRYTFATGDNITLTQGHLLDSFFGYNYSIAVNGQVPPIYIEGAEVTGSCTGSVTHYARDSRLGTVSTALELDSGAVFLTCGLVNVSLKDQAGAALDVEFLDCHGNTQGSMFPGGTVDFGTTAGTNHEVSFQRWGGPVTIVNLKDGDTVYAHGNGTFILDASCTGGSFRVAGMINLTDNSGSVSILQDGRITISRIADGVWDELRSGHVTAGTFGENVNADLTKINGDANSAARLALSAAQIIPGTVDSTVTPTTTVFEADDITEATADHYNGRLIVFTSGALAGQVASVTDYALNGGRGQFTVPAMTEAPADNDTFIIV